MLDLFTALTNLTYSSQNALLLAATFIWGVISVLFSPCHLTGIPLMVGYMLNREKHGIGKTLAMSGLFSVGIFLSILLVGLITGALGMMLGNLGVWGEIFLILVLIYFGLATIGVLPFMPGIAIDTGKKGLLGIFIAGLLFGTGLGPCTFAFMAPVLGVFLEKVTSNPIMAGSLIVTFGVGHCLVIILLGTFFDRLAFLGKSGSFGKWVRFISGSVLFLYGLYRLVNLLKNIF